MTASTRTKTKTKDAAQAQKDEGPKPLGIPGLAEWTMAESKARATLNPRYAATFVAEAYSKNLLGDDIDLNGMVDYLKDSLEKIADNDLSMVESMLFSQAVSLQTMFSSLARKASHQEYLKQYQVYLGMALKAQAQSRATLEALVELKQPRHGATFVKQANISQGHQQINNGAPAPGSASAFPEHSAHTPAHAADSTNSPNKLLDHQYGNYLDTGAQSQASRGHQDLETVGEVNRP